MNSPFLRPLRADDTDARDVLAAFRSAPDMDRQGEVTDLEEARRYVTRLAGDGSPHLAWAVEVSGELVGLVAVSVDEENLTGWFWYWMHAGHRGRGWAGRAAATVADWALADTGGGLHRLELGHRANNPASAAVARAAGFVREGIERQKFLVGDERVDVHVYGRLRSDPCPGTSPLHLSGTPDPAD